VSVPQSYPLTEKTSQDESPIYRNMALKNTKRVELEGNITTLDQQFNQVVKKYAQKNCFGQRSVAKITTKVVDGKQVEHFDLDHIQWTTYEKVGVRVKLFATGLAHLTGLNSGDKLAIYENTCIEWQIAAQACLRYGITIVTVYASLGIDAIITSLNQAEITSIMIGEELLSNVNSIAERVPTLKYIIYNTSKFKPNTFDISTLSKELTIIPFSKCETVGETVQVKVKNTPIEDDLALIMYTSGTTGEPKGVMHTHKSLCTMIARAEEEDSESYPIATRLIRHLAYLPLAHVLEFIAQMTVLNLGGEIGFGSPKTLSDRVCTPCGDMRAVRPNTLFGVPRVYETFKKLTWETIHDPSVKPIQKYLFSLAYERKKKALEKDRQTPLFNKLIFTKTKATLGGNVTAIMCGGAPLNPDTQQFLRIVFDAVVRQGYGLTEVGVASVQRLNYKMTVSNVGPLSYYAEIKLRSVADMGYTVQDKPHPRGEILIRGDAMFKGYYKRSDLTNQVLNDGWFSTGDIGSIDDRGFLKIIDRKKNLVKLDNGEFVPIEKLEGVYQNSPFISPNGICVYADSTKSYCIANIIPQSVYARRWAAINEIEVTTLEELYKSPKLKQAVLESLLEEAKKAHLNRFEELRDIRLHNDEWTVENGMLTAAMKHQRIAMNKFYEKFIDEMYAR
jgi:long-chain acyl-CoA synthetase